MPHSIWQKGDQQRGRRILSEEVSLKCLMLLLIYLRIDAGRGHHHSGTSGILTTLYFHKHSKHLICDNRACFSTLDLCTGSWLPSLPTPMSLLWYMAYVPLALAFTSCSQLLQVDVLVQLHRTVMPEHDQ